MEFRIEDRLIGDGHPAFIIAELSANHMNDYDIAVKTIEAMAKSGADESGTGGRIRCDAMFYFYI